MWVGLVLGLGLGLGLVLGLGLDYGLGFSSDIRLRHDPQLRVSHLATISFPEPSPPRKRRLWDNPSPETEKQGAD